MTSGPKIVSELKFDVDNTISDSPMLELINKLSHMLDDLKSLSTSRNKGAVMQQLVLILADGRLHENKDNLQKAVRNLSTQNGVLLVFIILDSSNSGECLEGFEKSQSIVDMQSVSFENGKPKFERYLDSFPFPYYVILKNSSDLPRTLGNLLKQWIELSMS